MHRRYKFLRKTAAAVILIIFISSTSINAYAADGSGFSRGLVLDASRT